MNFLVLMVAIMLPGSQLQRSLAGGLPLVIPAAKRPEEGGGGQVPPPGADPGRHVRKCTLALFHPAASRSCRVAASVTQGSINIYAMHDRGGVVWRAVAALCSLNAAGTDRLVCLQPQRFHSWLRIAQLHVQEASGE